MAAKRYEKLVRHDGGHKFFITLWRTEAGHFKVNVWVDDRLRPIATDFDTEAAAREYLAVAHVAAMCVDVYSE